MEVGASPRPGRKGDQVHADADGTDGLGRDAGKVGKPLLAVVGVADANDGAGRRGRGGHRGSLLGSARIPVRPTLDRPGRINAAGRRPQMSNNSSRSIVTSGNATCRTMPPVTTVSTWLPSDCRCHEV